MIDGSRTFYTVHILVLLLFIAGYIALVKRKKFLAVIKPMQKPNNETSSLCSWIHVCSPTGFLRVALLYFLFTGGIPNLPVNSFLSPWMCRNTHFHNDGSKQWPAQRKHTIHREHSEMQPIWGRTCLFIIMGNNKTLGGNCYTIPRPVIKLAKDSFYITPCKKKKKRKIRPGICYI